MNLMPPVAKAKEPEAPQVAATTTVPKAAANRPVTVEVAPAAAVTVTMMISLYNHLNVNFNLTDYRCT